MHPPVLFCEIQIRSVQRQGIEQTSPVDFSRKTVELTSGNKETNVFDSGRVAEGVYDRVGKQAFFIGGYFFASSVMMSQMRSAESGMEDSISALRMARHFSPSPRRATTSS